MIAGWLSIAGIGVWHAAGLLLQHWAVVQAATTMGHLFPAPVRPSWGPQGSHRYRSEALHRPMQGRGPASGRLTAAAVRCQWRRRRQLEGGVTSAVLVHRKQLSGSLDGSEPRPPSSCARAQQAHSSAIEHAIRAPLGSKRTQPAH